MSSENAMFGRLATWGTFLTLTLAGCTGPTEQTETARDPESTGDTATGGTVLAAYVLLTGAPEGASFPVARVILDGADTACPDLEAEDETGEPLATRPRPNPHGFPVRVCETRLPWERSYRVAGPAEGTGTRLPAAHKNPRHVVVFGDTGCKKSDCGESPATPFDSLASQAATLDPPPDLVLHAGDYNYRGTGSHVDFQGRSLTVYDAGDDAPTDPQCQLEGQYASLNAGYSTEPDTWDNWRLDFFEPARDLLAAAPWIVTRGNHELCSRAGPGWFYFLDPGLGDHAATCPAQGGDTPPEDGAWPHIVTAPWSIVDLGDLRVAVLDSANACDGFAPQATTDLYAAQFGQILSAIPDSEGETGASEVWLLTHRPVWAVEDDDGQRDQLSHTLQQGLQQALDQNGGTFPQGLTTLVSGHMHYFQSLTFPSGSRPPQLVAGNGGVSLWGSPTGTFSATADGQPAEGLGILEHGFLDIARRPGSSWNGRLLGASGALATCDPARQPRSLCVLENGDT